jgi:gamma-glutamyltranspeptidase
MDLKTSKRAAAATAAVAMTAGLTAILYGVIHNSPARSLAGVALITTALTVFALIAIKQWVTDTREEQKRFAQATRDAEAERAQYFAAKAALENEQQRHLRDVAADRAHAAATLIAEREKMAAEFEEKRAALVCETLAAYHELMHSEKKQQPERSSVIPFPTQQPERAPERGRSREHGVARP